MLEPETVNALIEAVAALDPLYKKLDDIKLASRSTQATEDDLTIAGHNGPRPRAKWVK